MDVQIFVGVHNPDVVNNVHPLFPDSLNENIILITIFFQILNKFIMLTLKIINKTVKNIYNILADNEKWLYFCFIENTVFSKKGTVFIVDHENPNLSFFVSE